MHVVSKEDAKGLQKSPIMRFGEIYIVCGNWKRGRESFSLYWPQNQPF
jgi:hypothetical protein